MAIKTELPGIVDACITSSPARHGCSLDSRGYVLVLRFLQ